MIERLTKLTDAQVAAMAVIRDQWLAIGLSTARCDRHSAQEAMVDVYKEAGLTPPVIFVWLESPLQGLQASAQMRAWMDEQVYEKIDEQMYVIDNKISAHVSSLMLDQVCEPVRVQVSSLVFEYVRAQMHEYVDEQVSDQVSDQVSHQVYDQVYEKVYKQMHRQSYAQISPQVSANVYGQVCGQISAQVSNEVRSLVSARVYGELRDQVCTKIHEVYSQVFDGMFEEVSKQVRGEMRALAYTQTSTNVSEKMYAQMYDQVYGGVYEQVYFQVRKRVLAQILEQMSDKIYYQICFRMYEQMSAQMHKQVVAQMFTQIHERIHDKVYEQTYEQVSVQICEQVYEQVYQLVSAKLHEQMFDQMRDQVVAQMSDRVCNQQETSGVYCGFGSQDASWLAFNSYLQYLGVKGSEHLIPLMRLAENCGWWWPMKNIVILTEKPVSILRDDRHRLHSPSGMAVQYADGWGVYAWHGVRVPEYVIMNSERITPEIIMQEENAEIRRVMILRYGVDRLFSSACMVHEGLYGKLYSMEVKGEILRAVRVVNGTPESDGTLKVYLIPVPTEIDDSDAAVAWTYRKKKLDYKPTIRT